MSNLTTFKISLIEAIARQEGWLDENSRCRRNHNPGNLEYGPFAIRNGALRGDGRFAVFPSDELGFAALSTLLNSPSYCDLSIELAIHKFAPSGENDTNRYIANVCEWSGVTPNTIINTLKPLTYERYVKDFRSPKPSIATVSPINKTDKDQKKV